MNSASIHAPPTLDVDMDAPTIPAHPPISYYHLFLVSTPRISASVHPINNHLPLNLPP